MWLASFSLTSQPKKCALGKVKLICEPAGRIKKTRLIGLVVAGFGCMCILGLLGVWSQFELAAQRVVNVNQPCELCGLDLLAQDPLGEEKSPQGASERGAPRSFEAGAGLADVFRFLCRWGRVDRKVGMELWSEYRDDIHESHEARHPGALPGALLLSQAQMLMKILNTSYGTFEARFDANRQIYRT